MPQDTPSRKLDQYIVRFPEGMRDVLKYAAAENKRSLNAEIVHRLDWTIMEDDARERDNRHRRSLESVGEGLIDPDDVADGGRTDNAPTADYEPTILDRITTQLTELAQQQADLAAQVSNIEELLAATKAGELK